MSGWLRAGSWLGSDPVSDPNMMRTWCGLKIIFCPFVFKLNIKLWTFTKVTDGQPISQLYTVSPWGEKRVDSRHIWSPLSLCCSLHRRRHILVWGLQLNQNEVREARGLALVCWEIFPRHGKMGEKFPCLSVCWCFICCVGDSTQISSLAVNHWTPHSSLWSSLFPVFCGLFLLFCEVGCLVCHKKYIVNSNNIWYLSQYYGIARKFNAGLPTCLVWAISLDWTGLQWIGRVWVFSRLKET